MPQNTDFSSCFPLFENNPDKLEKVATLIRTPEGQGRLPYMDKELMKLGRPAAAYVSPDRRMSVTHDFVTGKILKSKNELVTFVMTAVPEKDILEKQLKVVVESFGIDWFLPCSTDQIKVRARIEDFSKLEEIRMAGLYVRDRTPYMTTGGDEIVPNWVFLSVENERKATLDLTSWYHQDILFLMNNLQICGVNKFEFSSSGRTAKGKDEYEWRYIANSDSQTFYVSDYAEKGSVLNVYGEDAVSFIEKIRLEDPRVEMLKRIADQQKKNKNTRLSYSI